MQRSDLYYFLIYPQKFNPQRIMKMQSISCFSLFLSNVKQLHQFRGASLLAQMVKNLPARQETWVWSLSQRDPLEEEIVIHASIIAWRIPWTEEPDRLPFMGLQRVRHDWATNISICFPLKIFFPFIHQYIVGEIKIDFNIIKPRNWV